MAQHRLLKHSKTGKAKLPVIFPLLQQVNDALQDGFSENEMQVIIRFLNNVMSRFN